MAILRDVAESDLATFACADLAHVKVFEFHRPGVEAMQAEDALQQFGLTVAFNACDANDLSGC